MCAVSSYCKPCHALSTKHIVWTNAVLVYMCCIVQGMCLKPLLAATVTHCWSSGFLTTSCLLLCCAFSADHPDHLILFRKYVSRKAATKGRAVLEGVGLDSCTIQASFNSASEEAAVQDGLIKWKDGQGRQPPTWEVLISAMEYAEISQQHIEDLKKELCA